MSAWQPVVLVLLCSTAAGAALADDAEERSADLSFARIQARLCTEFEVCEPPCGSSQAEASPQE